MPIYEYQCRKCGEKFEKLVRSMTDSTPVACAKCGSQETARALSLFAVGAEGAGKSAPAGAPMCGRCGGPGPCAMGD
jgi:putative FmdB family regulatory protein